MNKAPVLLLPLFLSGCFMYDNIKQGFECSFDSSKCSEIKIKTDDELLNEVYAIIENRCSKMRKLRKGTLEYMDCNENLKGWFNALSNEYGFEDAKTTFFASLSSEENKCISYGMNAGTTNFSKCLAKLEEKDTQIALKNIHIEQEQKRAAIQSLADSLGSFGNSSLNCSSYTIGGTTTTKCY